MMQKQLSDSKMFPTATSFYKFITSVLRQKALIQEKKIEFEVGVNDLNLQKYFKKNATFDAIALNGFQQIDSIVIFEYKYNLSGAHQKRDLEKTFSYYNNIFAEEIPFTIVLIANSFINMDNILPEKNRYNFDYEILDRAVIEKWIEDYRVDYSNALASSSIKDKRFAEFDENDLEKKTQSNIDVLQNIVREKENFAIVLGAGISTEPGAKAWIPLLDSMKKELESKNKVDDSSSVSKKIGDSSLITAQLCKELYKDETDFCWAVHKGLYDNRASISPNFTIYQVIRIIEKCQRKKHFRVLTYNFDDYLENGLSDRGIRHNVLYDNKCEIDDAVSIYHIHGFLPYVQYKKDLNKRHISSIYLTEANYNDLYNHPYSWHITSQLSFFRENCCLFIGCSLTDPSLRRLLEMTKQENHTHFAILRKELKSDKDLVIATNHFARLGIEVIWIDDFKEIKMIVDKIVL